MISDAHLHFFTRGVFEFYAKQAPEVAAGPDPAAAAARKLGVEAPPADPEALASRWAAELDRWGVERAALFGSAPGEQEAVARAVRAFPGRFVGFQMLNPRAPAAAATLENIVSRGMRGILLFPAMHAYFPDEAVARPVYDAARRHGLIVFVHVGFLKIAIRDKLGVPGAIDERFGDGERLLRAVRGYPDVKFIAPHFGCGQLGRLLGGGVGNLYLDTSSSNEWTRGTPEFPDHASAFRAALDSKTFGPDRLLFGSDSTVFPRGWRKDVCEAQQAALDALGVGPAVKSAIFRQNFLTLCAK
jgi:hypothetical protein